MAKHSGKYQDTVSYQPRHTCTGQKILHAYFEICSQTKSWH